MNKRDDSSVFLIPFRVLPPEKQGAEEGRGISRSGGRIASLFVAGILGGGLLLGGLGPTLSWAAIGALRPEVMAAAQNQGLALVRTDQRNGYSALTFERQEPSSLPGEPPRTLTVREFLDTNGRSFGVAWRGAHSPNLSLLLGNLASRLPRVIHSPDRHRLFFQDGRLVLSVVGNARFQVGSAWDETRLPPGVTPDRIRVAP